MFLYVFEQSKIEAEKDAKLEGMEVQVHRLVHNPAPRDFSRLYVRSTYNSTQGVRLRYPATTANLREIFDEKKWYIKFIVIFQKILRSP